MRAVDLSDAELMQALRKNDVNTGPIVDSTRHLYRRKLCRVLGIEEDEDVDPNLFLSDLSEHAEEHRFVPARDRMAVEHKTATGGLLMFYGLSALSVLFICWYYLM